MADAHPTELNAGLVTFFHFCSSYLCEFDLCLKPPTKGNLLEDIASFVIPDTRVFSPVQLSGLLMGHVGMSSMSCPTLN